MNHYAKKLAEEINAILLNDERAVWSDAIAAAVSKAMARPSAIIDQYCEQKYAQRTGRGSFVDGAVQVQVEAAVEIADRIAGVRADEEHQITFYWSDILGQWVTAPEDEA